MRPLPHTTMLRLAAFLVDALMLLIVLIIPAAVISYSIAFMVSGSTRAINLTWYVALLMLMIGVLIRDGRSGRSFGKQLLGLDLATRSRARCSYARSIVRNLPLVVPGWNLIELYLVLFGPKSLRTGDRIAGTAVTQE
jgi:uncharacterized RDD family membrane protein YckC